MFSAEKELLKQIQIKIGTTHNTEIIIAIDEVGRGCVAGPVLTCASLWVKSQTQQTNQHWTSQVRDSKKLTPNKRLSCFNNVLAEFNYTTNSLPFKNSLSTPRANLLKPTSVVTYDYKSSQTVSNQYQSFQCIDFCLGEGDIEEVEKFNIWNAVQIAASRALLGLKEKYFDKNQLSLNKTIILMDGNKPLSVPAPFVNIIQATAVKGDDLFVSIGLSSVLAKVYRDLFMESQESLYPQFGFARHKGYGTTLHMENILKYGTCPLHRQSFLKKSIPLPSMPLD